MLRLTQPRAFGSLYNLTSGGFQADVNMSLKIGDVFSCYEDFKDKLEKYQDENYILYVVVVVSHMTITRRVALGEGHTGKL